MTQFFIPIADNRCTLRHCSRTALIRHSSKLMQSDGFSNHRLLQWASKILGISNYRFLFLKGAGVDSDFVLAYSRTLCKNAYFQPYTHALRARVLFLLWSFTEIIWMVKPTSS